MKYPLRFLFLVSVLAVAEASAQVKIKSISLSDTIIYATVDRPGDLYVITKGGQIQRFAPDATLGVVYKHGPLPTQFDPRDGSRLFAYFRNDRHYAFYNPSFDMTASYHLDSSFVIEPWLVTISGDHDIWVVDAADGSLKKVTQTTETVDIDVKIPAGLYKDIKAFTSLREYQGFVFLLQPHKGIQVFSRMGKWLRTIESPTLKSFNFIGEELYYIEKDRLKFFNLFTAETREQPLLQPAHFVLVTDERIYSIRNKTIDFFTPKP
jgi:sugar lactone lactonase YvrE